MKLVFLILGACFLWAEVVFANTCSFKAVAELGGQPMMIEECWDLKTFSKQELSQFCIDDPDMAAGKVKKCEGKTCVCPKGAQSQCQIKMPEAMVAASLPEEYFKQNNITGEMRKQIEANMKKLNSETKTPGAGKTVRVHYYKGASKEDLRKYCKDRGGNYTVLN